MCVDNKSLVDATHTTNVLTERRLMIDMAALREMSEQNQIVVRWVATDHQLANVLTKCGASKVKLCEVISSGILPDIVSGIIPKLN